MRYAIFCFTILLLTSCCRMHQPPEPGSAGIIVIVHGAWGGPHDWKDVDHLLTARGYEVYRPALTGQGERVHLAAPENNLSTHVQDIINVIEFEDLHDIILIGHSYGGMVITNVAHRIPDRIHEMVYVDACLPLDGESLFGSNVVDEKWAREQARDGGDGWLIPVTWDVPKDVPQQLAAFEEPSHLGSPEAEKIPAAYILYGKDPAAARFAKYADRARERGWPVIERPWGHNAHRQIPGEFTQLLLETIQGLK